MNENASGVGEPRDHSHHHAHGNSQRLGIAAFSNIAFAVVQVIVGLAIGSVVVLADAAHQTVDALGLITALIALRFSVRPASSAWTYGMGKSDALGGFVSALLLLGSVAWILVESIRRFFEPAEVSGISVMIIGVIAIVVNGIGVLLVGHGHGDEAVSLRAARLHLITDLLGSVVVVASGALLALGGPSWIDPAASVVLSVAVIWTTWRLLRSAAAILLDRAPERVGSTDIADLLGVQPGVDEVHHVHLRPLGGGRVSASAHVVVDGEMSVHDVQRTVERLSGVLLATHEVSHTTLQVECHPCEDGHH